MLDDETQLIREAQAGKQQAFAALYDQNQAAVYTYIYYRVNDQETAEDLTAEVFVRMVDKIGRYKPQGKPILAWLYTIARNQLTDHYRQTGKATWMPMDDSLADTCNPAAKTETQLTANCLQTALSHLTDDQQQVIIGKFVEDRSNANVASLLGKTEGSVKSLQHRALAALRRAVEKEGCYDA